MPAAGYGSLVGHCSPGEQEWHSEVNHKLATEGWPRARLRPTRRSCDSCTIERLRGSQGVTPRVDLSRSRRRNHVLRFPGFPRTHSDQAVPCQAST